MRFRERRCIGSGLAAGLAGGLAGSWVMNQVHAIWSKASQKLTERKAQEQSQPEQAGGGQSDEPATVKAAKLIWEKAAHRPLPDERKETAGAVVHYAFGAATGALYGALAEVWPPARTGFGTLFGVAVWATADEIAVPAAGLAKGPADYPVSVHARALVAHVVYGASTEAVRRCLRTAMKGDTSAVFPSRYMRRIVEKFL
jgi:hypothetical protein